VFLQKSDGGACRKIELKFQIIIYLNIERKEQVAVNFLKSKIAVYKLNKLNLVQGPDHRDLF
jgi:hypothetical protein